MGQIKYSGTRKTFYFNKNVEEKFERVLQDLKKNKKYSSESAYISELINKDFEKRILKRKNK